MKGRRIDYTAEELEWLEENRTLPISLYARLFNMWFGRDVSAVNLNALRKRRGWSTGRTGRFEKGAAPSNKGRRCAPGEGGRHPNAVRTQFRKGSRNGRAAQRYQPIGAERLSKEGYPERKVHDGLPLRSRWRAIHLIRWEEVNGPVPPGHCLKSLDGSKTNTDPSNWVCIPRALLPRLNGGTRKRKLAYADAEPEVRPALIAIAQLEHQAREKPRAA